MNIMLRRAALGLAVTMLVAILGVTTVVAQQAGAQQGGIKRTILEKSDVAGTNYETVLGIADIPPNTDFASHTHPGTESSYVLQGEITLNVKGQPTREVKAGEAILIPTGVPHSGRAGPNGAKILAAWTVLKDKPLASPAAPFAQ